jgi:hypothetical protein
MTTTPHGQVPESDYTTRGSVNHEGAKKRMTGHSTLTKIHCVKNLVFKEKVSPFNKAKLVLTQLSTRPT